MLESDKEHPDKLLHREITEKIIGAAFEVYNELGHAFAERVYQRALQVELVQRGTKAEWEKRTKVLYKGINVGDYDCDLVIDDVVIVETKVSPEYDKRDEAQLLNLLKSTGFRVGLLVNFGRYKVAYKRLIL